MAARTETPPDWAEVAPTMCIRDLAYHYGLSRRVVAILAKRTGIKPKRVLPGPTQQNKAARREAVARGLPVRPIRAITPNRPASSKGRPLYLGLSERVTDRADDAAHYLRRTYRIHRADIVVTDEAPKGKVFWGDLHGLPNRGTGFYVVGGRGVMEADAVISLAREKGWTG